MPLSMISLKPMIAFRGVRELVAHLREELLLRIARILQLAVHLQQLTRATVDRTLQALAVLLGLHVVAHAIAHVLQHHHCALRSGRSGGEKGAPYRHVDDVLTAPDRLVRAR